MKLIRNPKVEEVFNNFESAICPKLKYLRQIILETAVETEGLDALEETLKWGEPSYLTKHGSTIRISKHKSGVDRYAIFFKCTSKLVPTFKAHFSDLFTYENNRAIVFGLEDEVPVSELKQCIRLALTYHKVKKLPMLGIIDNHLIK